MVSTISNSKQAWLVDFSTKDHFNQTNIDRDMVNFVGGMNIEVLGDCVDETIV